MQQLSKGTSGRVLVVGATGFVGRRLVPELGKLGIPLRLVARNLAGLSPLLQKDRDIEIWKKPLSGGEFAIGLLNRSRGTQEVTVKWSENQR